LFKTMDNIHLHMFDCALLYKTMANIHLHMFDCAFTVHPVLYCTRQFNWCMVIVFPPSNVNLEM
jgi:hypothetical protein